jgi:hypothetical protein
MSSQIRKEPSLGTSIRSSGHWAWLAVSVVALALCGTPAAADPIRSATNNEEAARLVQAARTAPLRSSPKARARIAQASSLTPRQVLADQQRGEALATRDTTGSEPWWKFTKVRELFSKTVKRIFPGLDRDSSEEPSMLKNAREFVSQPPRLRQPAKVARIKDRSTPSSSVALAERVEASAPAPVPAPEPSTVVLLGLAAAGYLARSWRSGKPSTRQPDPGGAGRLDSPS